MTVKETAEIIGGAIVASGNDSEIKQVTGVYSCDLLSWVMAHAKKGDAWITVHSHVNIVAVALLTEVSCIVVPEAIKVEAATIARAKAEGVAIIETSMTAYEVCCRLQIL